MKTSSSSPLHQSLFSRDSGGHQVGIIKADPQQAARHAHSGHGANGTPEKAAQVRMVGTGPDYCDLEFVCACGQVTKFRCWNTPGAEGDKKSA